MAVAIASDELWLGVKGQSNWEIARSRRNQFKLGAGELRVAGSALVGG